MTDEGGQKTVDLVRRLLLDDTIEQELRAELERLTDADIKAMSREMVWQFSTSDMVDRVATKLGVGKKAASKLVRQRLSDISSLLHAEIKESLRTAILMGMDRRMTYLQMAITKGDYNAANRIEDGILKVGEFFGANEPAEVRHTIEDRTAEIKERVLTVLKLKGSEDGKDDG